jgi:clan AA aspartic protease (TIGR02281 family)
MASRGEGVVGLGVIVGIVAIAFVGLITAGDDDRATTSGDDSATNAPLAATNPVDVGDGTTAMPAESGVGNPGEEPAQTYGDEPGTYRIPLTSSGGVMTVPVTINEQVVADFTVDSGASDVTVSEDLVLSLLQKGSIAPGDFVGSNKYILADGSVITSQGFTIRKLMVGEIVVRDVRGSIAKTGSPLLLGQSFLKRFKRWHIDNDTRELVLEE